MRRVVLIGVASVIALVASMAVAGPLPKGGTFAGIAGGGSASALSGTIADNTVVCGTGASTVDSNAALTCTGGALGATTVTTTTGASIATTGATPTAPDATNAMYVSCNVDGQCGMSILNDNTGSSTTAKLSIGAGAGENSGVISAYDQSHATWPDRFEIRSTSESTGVNIAASAPGADIRFLASAGNPFDTSDEKARINADGTTCWGATSCTETMSITGTLSATGTSTLAAVTASGTATLNGNVVLGSDTADAVTLNADLITVANDTVVDLTTPAAGALTFTGGQTLFEDSLAGQEIPFAATAVDVDSAKHRFEILNGSSTATEWVTDLIHYSTVQASASPFGMHFISYLDDSDDIAGSFGGMLFTVAECSDGKGSCSGETGTTGALETSLAYRFRNSGTVLVDIPAAGGIVISGATTDITTGTNEDLALTPNGTGSVTLGASRNLQTCTLNGGSPSTCTATVRSGATCMCTPVGATAAIAAGGCATSVTTTTVTATSANGLTNNVNLLCF